jgi:hypothetical protein
MPVRYGLSYPANWRLSVGNPDSERSRSGKYAAAFEDTRRYETDPGEPVLFSDREVVKLYKPWHASMNEVLNGWISSMERLVISVKDCDICGK